jgi:hypothetical protein
MHYDATTEITMYKFDAAIRELTTGTYATLTLSMWKGQDTKITANGLFYIAEGGYPTLKDLTPPHLNGLTWELKRTFCQIPLIRQDKMLNAVLEL